MSSSKPQAFLDLIQTVHRLRAPGGCPWDRKQTHRSLRPYLIEETYEVLEILDRMTSDEDLAREDIRSSLKEELGDVLMQVVLHSEMTSERGAFDIWDVAAGLNDKLIRRHPHVFGDVVANDADQVVKNWEAIKKSEKGDAKAGAVPSALDGLTQGLPALQRAGRVIQKVTAVGFQWPDLKGPLDKLEEELRELRAEVEKLEAAKAEAKNDANPDLKTASLRAKVANEIGDVFFSLANVSHLLGVEPETALREQLARFEKRFRHIETRLAAQGRTPKDAKLEEMDLYWNEAKELEKKA